MARYLQSMSRALEAFQKSGAAFKVLRSGPENDAKVLYILDSSFNPPSIAHRALAEAALSNSSCRMLLLFSTNNADKAPSPAAFDQRLAMMALFAEEFDVPVDIGVTTAPYYTDKSLAIEREGPYKAKHVHLVGYDTMVRVFTAKYYPKFQPPFSALDPYFDAGHEFRMTLRPDGEGLDRQKQLIEDLAAGKMSKDGGKPEWADQVHIVPPNPRAGVSSTKIREAAKAGDWETVKDLCPSSVAEYLQQEKLYQ